MYEFLNSLDAKMTQPGLYGTFHLVSLIIVILAATLLSVFGKNAKDKAFRGICVFFWILYFLFEAYKQINYSFNYNGGQPYWDYQWYAFPFQLCSAPLYILPFVFATKEGGFARRAAVAFMSTYVLFAGMAVMVYPGDVFVETIGINIQTMFWHGSQVILGVFFLTRHRKALNGGFFLAGFLCFLVMVGVAVGLDLLIPNFTDETFNMFFISPKYPSTLPVLSAFWGKVPWPAFLGIYIVGYTTASFIVFLAAKGIKKLNKGKD